MADPWTPAEIETLRSYGIRGAAQRLRRSRGACRAKAHALGLPLWTPAMDALVLAHATDPLPAAQALDMSLAEVRARLWELL